MNKRWFFCGFNLDCIENGRLINKYGSMYFSCNGMPLEKDIELDIFNKITHLKINKVSIISISEWTKEDLETYKGVKIKDN